MRSPLVRLRARAALYLGLASATAALPGRAQPLVQTPAQAPVSSGTQPGTPAGAHTGVAIRTYRVLGDTYGCEDRRATRALTDTATARLKDPDWVNFFVTDGKCIRIRPSSDWELVSTDGEMSLLVNHQRRRAPPVFVRSDLLDSGHDAAPADTATADGTTPESAAASQEPADAFAQGQADRKTWEAWLSGLQGDARLGAEHWARPWAALAPASCDGAGQPPAWQDGCQAARLRALGADVRRRSEPFYAQGWNDPQGQPPAGAQDAAKLAKEAGLRRSAPYRAGQADRRRWEEWFAGFLGDYRAGAAFSFEQFGRVPKQSCADATRSDTWREGCEMARRRLATAEARRLTDPVYAQGWDDMSAPAQAPAAKPPALSENGR